MHDIDEQTMTSQATSAQQLGKTYTFVPSTFSGTLTLPPSKSYLHRYLLATALANTSLTLRSVTTIADDVNVTLEILRHFGFDYNHDEAAAELHLMPTPQARSHSISMNMKESGTSLRLFLPSLIHCFEHVELTGENQLPTRALAPYLDALTAVDFTKTTENNLPLQASGAITPRDYTFEDQMSSQFMSGLLFVLPLLEADSTITLKNEPQSLPYIQMTIEVLRQFQININHNDTYTSFTIPGNQRFIAPIERPINIEPDYSARAFWDVASAIGHGALNIQPSSEHTLQGDAGLAQLIAHGQTDIDIAGIPDLAPILALYLSQTTGGVLHNVHVLIDKESDRLAAIVDFLTQSAIPFVQLDNALQIGTGHIQGGLYDTYRDHRITMMLAIAASLATGPIVVREVTSIDKSYPTFIEHYKQVGGIIHEQ